MEKTATVQNGHYDVGENGQYMWWPNGVEQTVSCDQRYERPIGGWNLDPKIWTVLFNFWEAIATISVFYGFPFSLGSIYGHIHVHCVTLCTDFLGLLSRALSCVKSWSSWFPGQVRYRREPWTRIVMIWSRPAEHVSRDKPRYTWLWYTREGIVRGS